MTLTTLQKQQLISMASSAKNSGGSLLSVFDKFASQNNKASGSIRNTYYKLVKQASINQVIKTKYFGNAQVAVQHSTPFSKEQTKSLIKSILIAKTFGKSARQCISILACGNAKQMLRLQNKYRNMLKHDKQLVLQTVAEVKFKFGRCFDPYKQPTPQTSLELAILKNQINTLADRLVSSYKQKTEKLEQDIESRDKQITSLKSMLKL